MNTLILLLVLFQTTPEVIRGLERRIIQMLQTQVSFTSPTNGCKIAPDGVLFDLSIASVGGRYRKFGYIKNIGTASCVPGKVIVPSTARPELRTRIPSEIPPGKFGTIILIYRPINHGIDTWHIQVEWENAAQ
jgi:hypothetical protein